MSAISHSSYAPSHPARHSHAQPCDLCGAAQARFVLATPRLDGPLVRCPDCGLYYVALPASRTNPTPAKPLTESERAAAEMQRLSARARELELVEPHVEESEGYWRELTARERFDDLLRAASGAAGRRLLEIGCSTGEFLSVARATFSVSGVEADGASCAAARARGLECFNGALADAHFPTGYFDVVALYHVIEHLPSPRCTLGEIRRVLRPGGWLIIETPNIASIWFRLLGARWRQFIPDHIFFFTPETITQACQQSGFTVRQVRSVGKAMSVRLFISRLGRYSRPLSRVLAATAEHLDLSDRTLRLNFGDVMRVYAEARRPYGR